MTLLIILIPLFPLLGFIINGIGFRKLNKKASAWVANLAIIFPLIFSIIIFANLAFDPQAIQVNLFEWISISTLQVDFGFYIDRLTILMLLVISGVGFLIHLYSIGYMHNDQGFQRFFAFMNLFVFFMLLLVMAENYLILFIGWEGVGLCSYFLIGFWNENKEFNHAARKAFIVNRIGDLGFLIAIFFIWSSFHSLSFTSVFDELAKNQPSQEIILAITLCLFIGTTGKSAQIPLYTWLPDAMAGPTPVSALIHAATMVTAGIYLIARSGALFLLSPIIMQLIVIVGVATALFAAIIAIKQNDIKKILAYSTISQLGYMFVALGLGAFSSAMFHLITHAFFKALLFLIAGVIIHSLHNEQDIRNMGGLKSKLPKTYWLALIGILTISGIPPFSGFFSKDLILSMAWEYSPVLWGFTIIGAGLTAFYMFRLFFIVFFNETRFQKQIHHEEKTMIRPLWILAFLSIFGGLMNIPSIFGGSSLLDHYLIVDSGHETKHLATDASVEWILMGISVAIVSIGFFLAKNFYLNRRIVPVESMQLHGFAKVVANKFYIDELYDKIFVSPINRLSTLLEQKWDRKLFDAPIENITRFVAWNGKIFSKLQTGNTGLYIIFMMLGLMGLLVYELYLN